MKPTIKIDAFQTRDGEEMVLFEHDGSYRICLGGDVLMNSRQHESELELARLGCHSLMGRGEATVLIGGLGMGYSARQALDLVASDAHVVVCELMPQIIEWHERYTAALTGTPLADRRASLERRDVLDAIRGCDNSLDAILLDVDNGPSAMTEGGNRQLYDSQGIEDCMTALKPEGRLAVWSGAPDRQYERRLGRAGFHVRRFRVPAYPNAKSQFRFVFVASIMPGQLPPGGGELKAKKRER